MERIASHSPARHRTICARGVSRLLCRIAGIGALLLILICGLCTRAASAQTAGPGQIEGTVTNAKGGAIAQAIISVIGPTNRSEMSDAQGRYLISGLAPGAYSIEVARPGYVPNRLKSVEVKSGGSIEIPVVLVAAPNETVIVTASRIEADLASAPAAVSVVRADQIAAAASSNIGDLLRAVPGLNVVQTTAREFNLASRQASPTLTNSQIALVDGRSIYSDFYNVVFWDLIPVNTSDIKQIEVVRGPVSAVWGANAATGAVNIITKTPREAAGLSFTLSGGGFSRDAGSTAGSGVGGFGGASVAFSQAVNDRWAYRISTGYSFSDAFPRPTGTVAVARSPIDSTMVVGGGSYDAVSYRNPGTRQPKFDLRVDQDLRGGTKITYEGGFAASQGIIHTITGPFRLEPGSYAGYGRFSLDKGSLRLSAFANYLNGEAPALLTRNPEGNPLRIDFRTGSYDLTGGYTQLVASRHLLNYGLNVRHSTFDISLAPNAKGRTEVGGYFEDEILLGKFRVPLGLRLDKFSNISSVIFSPRMALVFKPIGDHSVRFSFNRANRSPSAIDNYVDIRLVGGYFPLGAINPLFGNQMFPIVTHSFGNTQLKAESLTAWEIGYAGTFASHTNVGLAVYLNDSNHVINNLMSPSALIAAGLQPFYTSQNPPPGWPLPPSVLVLLAQQGIYLPANVQMLNFGKLRNKGLEFSVTQPINRMLGAFANYSYQSVPESRSPMSDPYRYPGGLLPVPPRNRVNAGINLHGKRYLGDFSINHAGKAYWADALDPTYYGYTGSYTMVNTSFGVRWAEGKVTTSVKAINLLNDSIQQHIFGDILKRRIFGELQFGF